MGLIKTIGIDPGKNGGIAVMSDDVLLSVQKMPPTPKDLFDALQEHKDAQMCYLEKVGGMPGNGGPSMFNFGKGYGNIEMALIALKIPFTTVTPQKWQKEYQLGVSKGLTTTQWKNKLREKAQQLFPFVSIKLWGADALLIARYGYEQEAIKYNNRR